MLEWGNTSTKVNNMTDDKMTNENINRLMTQADSQIAEMLGGDEKAVEQGESLNQLLDAFGRTEKAISMLRAGGLKLSLRGGLSTAIQADIDTLESALTPIAVIIDNLGPEGRHLQTRGSKKNPSVRHTGKTFISMIKAAATRNAKDEEKLEATE
jgi:hypothetical protein